MAQFPQGCCDLLGEVKISPALTCQACWNWRLYRPPQIVMVSRTFSIRNIIIEVSVGFSSL
jgi:hypothetical protein